MDDFLQKLKKVVLIVLYELAIDSQSDCIKAGPYQLPIINLKVGSFFGTPCIVLKVC